MRRGGVQSPTHQGTVSGQRAAEMFLSPSAGSGSSLKEEDLERQLK